MRKEEEMSIIKVRRWIREKCTQCNGSGTISYSGSSQWRRHKVDTNYGGRGICDKCWGSGDQSRPWANLKELEIKLGEAIDVGRM